MGNGEWVIGNGESGIGNGELAIILIFYQKVNTVEWGARKTD